MPELLHAPPPPPRLEQPVTRVYANWGRWIVECECRAADVARPFQGSWTCPWCGCLYQVIWPSRDRARMIELVLAPRPPQHRNWWPWETVDQLVAENLEHGIAVPKGAIA